MIFLGSAVSRSQVKPMKRIFNIRNRDIINEALDSVYL